MTLLSVTSFNPPPSFFFFVCLHSIIKTFFKFVKFKAVFSVDRNYLGTAPSTVQCPEHHLPVPVWKSALTCVVLSPRCSWGTQVDEPSTYFSCLEHLVSYLNIRSTLIKKQQFIIKEAFYKGSMQIVIFQPSDCRLAY